MPKKTRQTAPLDSGKSVLRFERIITCHCFPAVLQCLFYRIGEEKRPHIQMWSDGRSRARARSAAVGHDSQFQLFFPEFSKSHKNGGKERERESNACGRPRPVDQGKKEMENHSNGPVTLTPDLVMQLLHFNDTQNRQF